MRAAVWMVLLGCATAHAGLLGRKSDAPLTEAERELAAAEHVRISDEIVLNVERQRWPAVERSFQELAKRGLEPSRQDYVHASTASRALGDMQAAYDRLRRATAGEEPPRQLVEQLRAIDANFGTVELVSHGAKNVELVPEEMPFDVDQRTAVQAAAQRVAKEGRYTGMLPRGGYVFAQQSFKVEPGYTLRIEVSPRMKRTQGIVVPAGGASASDR
ncbi:MAG: hypothetical protein RLZZ299_2249 [Pseudomonadota bacterium]